MEARHFLGDRGLPRFQITELDDQRDHLTALGDGGGYPVNALRHVLGLSVQQRALIVHVATLGELNNVLDGLRRQRVRFDPLELLERLAVLTPRPRVNLILYYGILAPRAAWRSALVPADGDGASLREAEGDASGVKPSRAGAYQWAELMRRTFGVDVLACPHCGGRLRLVALIDQASVIQRILRHLGLPTDIPEPRPARAPPRHLDFTDDQAAQDASEFNAAW